MNLFGRKFFNRTILLSFLFVFAITNSSSVFAGPSLTTYQAKIITPNGDPLESPNVTFKFSILNPATDCIVYSELYSSVNMSGSKGLISFGLGTGVRTYPTSGTVTFEKVFSNATPSLACEAGSPATYSPSANDTRKIVMQFFDGAAWQTLPAMSINAVPYAMYANDAQKLNGKADSDFVEVASIPTCSANQALFFNGMTFSCVSTQSVSATAVVAALGYTPANAASVTTITSTVGQVSSTVAAVSSSLTSLSNSVAASFAAIAASSGVGSLNGSTSATQTFANGVAGTSPLFNTSNGVHTLNIPLASAGSVTAGLISNLDYLNFAGKITSSAASIAQVLGYIPASATTFTNYVLRANNLSDLTSATVARTNLGLGSVATLNTIDLSSSQASGLLDEARLPSFVGITSGTQYTKVTVDGKGRVVSAAQLSATDVTTALGFTPTSATAAGITSFNGSTSSTQSFANGVAGTAPQFNTASGLHTLNIPLASAASVTAGLISNLDYLNFAGKITSSSASIAEVLGYLPASATTFTNYVLRANNLSDLASATVARTNLGLGAVATLNTIDLGSSQASGVIDEARLPSFASVTSGTQYTKVTVDGKGRVVSAAQLSSSDVTTALGFTPSSATAGITSFNGSTSSTQSFANGTAGTAPQFTTALGLHTLNIPLASTTSVTAGLISNLDYLNFAGKITSSSAAIAEVLGYVPASATTFTNYVLRANNLSDLASATVARTNLGLGVVATLNTIDLSSSQASGVLDEARLPSFTGVTSGTQYTKVTVDGKGRVVSAAQLSATDVTLALGFTPSSSTAGVTSLNGSTSATQSFANGVTGLAPQFNTAAGVHTLNIPLASAGSVTAGLISNLDYLNFAGKITSSSAAIAEVLGYVPASATTFTNYVLRANNLSDLASATVARTNLGLGAVATLNTIDLSSSQASGILDEARLPSFSGLASGTQYTKVTVDGKGRVVSASQLSASDVTTALGFTPSSSGSGITSFNGSTSSTQSFANGTTGTAPQFITASGLHTLNIPLASAASVTAGLISNLDYLNFANKITSSSASIAEVLGYVPASATTFTNYVLRANNLSDLSSATVARTNLGLGAVATLNSIDLSSSQASGVIDETRLPTFAGITSGTQYTKVTVDGKGRVVSASQLSANDVTTALGFTPSSSGSGITSFNGSSSITQSFATGTTGTAPQFNTAAGVHTLNIPLASAASVTAGLISNLDYLNFANKITSSSAAIAQVLGYVPVSATSLTNYVLRSNDLSDLASATVARTNLGLGAVATLNNVDLSSSQASGILNEARLPSFVGVTSGTQYTKVTVDGKGRVVSASQLSSTDVTTALGFTPSSSTAGVTSFNGSTSSTQTFANGVAGLAPQFNTAAGVHTLNIPLASAGSVTAGLISNLDYLNFANKITSSSAAIAEVLGYVPASATTFTNYVLRANNLSDLASATVARINLGLGSLAILNSIDLGSSQASGTLSVARLPAFSGDVSSSSGTAALTLASIGAGVVSGSQYTKVTVDGKGRVVSAAQLSSSDVTTALGYTPSSATVSSQWVTSGATISFNTGNVGIGTTAPSVPLSVVAETNSPNNQVRTVIDLTGTNSSGNGADGIGAGIRFNAEHSDGSILPIGRIDTTVNQAIDTAQIDFSVYDYDNAADARMLSINSSGVSIFDRNNPTSVYTKVATDGLQFNTTYLTSGAATSSLLWNTGGGPATGISMIATENHDATKHGGAIVFSTKPNGGSTSFGERMRINNDGNVGIGTTLPNYFLHINNSSGPDVFQQFTNTITGTSPTDGLTIGIDSTGGNIAVRENQPLYFATSGTEKMRILASGNVGIGTTTPSAKLHLSSGTSTVASFKLTSGTLLASPASGSIEYDGFDFYFTNGTNTRRSLTSYSGAASGVTSFNGSTSATQTFANGTTGTAPLFNTTAGVHTLNIPLASAASVTAGLISNLDYLNFAGKITSSSASIAQVLGFLPVSSTTLSNYVLRSNDLSDLASATVARTNLGLGALAVLNTVDLSSSQASGLLSVSRLPAFSGDASSIAGSSALTLASVGSGVVSGSQYTKVTVDGKGRVVSASQLTSADVTTALGFTPASGTGSSQWVTSGSTISYNTGNVGIGTTNPNSKLTVEAGMTLKQLASDPAGTATYGSLYVKNDGNLFYRDGTGSIKNLSASSGGDLKADGSVAMTGTLQTNSIANNSASSPMMIINDYSTGLGKNIEIKTGSCGSSGCVAGDILLNAGEADSGANNGSIRLLTSDGLERLTVDGPTGFVGIGTTMPTAKLHLSAGNSWEASLKLTSGTLLTSPASGSIEYDGFDFYFTNGTNTRRSLSSYAGSGAGSGVTTFNGSTSSTQTFANGTIGTSPLFSTANGVHTLNIPLASAASVTAGLISNLDYLNFAGKITSSSASIAQVLGYAPVSSTTLTNYVLRSNNLSDLTSATVARTNLGLGALSILSTVDLGSSQASGILNEARLPSFVGVTSGTQYTKVTVDGKGRVVSGSQLTSLDVTTALGFTPASGTGSSQWATSGTTISYSTGNVGIGTSSPSNTLTVAGAVESTAGGFSSTASGTGTLELTAGAAPAAPADGVGGLYINTSGMLQCQYGASQANCIPSYSTATNSISSNVAITNPNQYYDGPSVTLAAGSWMVMGTVSLFTYTTSAVVKFTCKLYDGTTAFASSEASVQAAASVRNVSISLSALVTTATSKTYYIACASTVGGQTLAAAAPDNGAGNNASTLNAVRTK